MKKYPFLCFLMFLVGIGRQIEYELFARINLADSIAIISFPFIFHAIPFRLKKTIFRFNIFIILYLFSSLYAGIKGNVPFEFMMKGFMKPLFITGYFYFFIWALSRYPKCLVYFVCGSICSVFVNYYFPGKWDEVMINKGDYGNVVAKITPLIGGFLTPIFYLSYKKSRLAGSFVSLLNPITKGFVGAARSSLMISTVPSIFYFLISLGFFKKVKGRIHIRPSSLILIGCVVLVSALLFTKTYSYMAPRGMLGEEHRTKYEIQTSTVFGDSLVGLLMAGRPQVYAAYLGVKDHLIIGVGSWNRFATADYMLEAAEAMGATVDKDQLYDSIYKGGGAGHSILFQEWLEQGIGAGLFWIFAFYIGIKLFVMMLQNDCLSSPLYISSVIGFSWAFFFSPLDSGTRLSVPLFMATYYILNSTPDATRFLRSFDYRQSWSQIFSTSESSVV